MSFFKEYHSISYKKKKDIHNIPGKKRNICPKIHIIISYSYIFVSAWYPTKKSHWMRVNWMWWLMMMTGGTAESPHVASTCKSIDKDSPSNGLYLNIKISPSKPNYLSDTQIHKPLNPSLTPLFQQNKKRVCFSSLALKLKWKFWEISHRFFTF